MATPGHGVGGPPRARNLPDHEEPEQARGAAAGLQEGDERGPGQSGLDVLMDESQRPWTLGGQGVGFPVKGAERQDLSTAAVSSTDLRDTGGVTVQLGGQWGERGAWTRLVARQEVGSGHREA